LKFGAVADNVLRRERREELTGAERTAFTEALMELEKLEDGLSKFAKLKSFTDFVSYTDENLIKWIGDEIISLGYCGFRERSSQYWLWDLRAEKLPYEHKGREVLAFYGLDTRLRIYGLSIPSQEQAEAWLLEFLDNVKKWPRAQIVWLIRNFYPLSDDTGGFWTVVRKIVELESLRDAWEDKTEGWKRDVESALKKTPQFEVLKTVLLSEWDAEKYLRGLAEDLEKEFLEKYGAVTADIEKVKEEFYDRAVELLRERVAPEERLREVYEQIKPLIPADKVELTRAGLWKAIRWAFMHPQWSVDVFASGHVFPLGFTTEEAGIIASNIMEKVAGLRPLGEREFKFRLWQEQRMWREKKPRERWTEEDKKLMAMTFEEWLKMEEAPPPPMERVKVRFLKYLPSIIGADMKVYGPFEEGSVAELPKVNADVLVKQGIATYELVPPPVPPVVPEKVSREEFMRAFDEALFEWIPHAIEGHKPGLSGRLHYEAPEFEAETLAKFSMDTVLSKWENVIAKEKEDQYRRYVETTPEHAKRILVDIPEYARHLAFSLVEKTETQLFEEAKAKVPVRPPELPTEEIEKLRRVVMVKAGFLGLEYSPKVWDAFWRDYQARARELWATRRISYLEEEVEDVLRAVAPPPAPPKPPVRPPVEIPVEAPPEIFIEPTAPPKEPISPLPFPRSPTTEERDRLWRAFMYEMSRIGQDPYRWREAFRMHVLDRPYRFWGDLLSNFREFVEAVRTGREYRFIPLVTVPMPWRPEEKPEERKEDAIIHFIATKLYPTMDELIYALRTYGVEATEQQIKEAAKKAYKEKNVWFTSVPKDFIESLIGEKVD